MLRFGERERERETEKKEKKRFMLQKNISKFRMIMLIILLSQNYFKQKLILFI